MASNAYRIKSVVTAVGTIGGVIDVQESVSGDTTEHVADNTTNVEAIWVDNVRATISVTTTDASLIGSYTMGLATTALVITREQRANGTGAVSMGDITSTYDEVVVTDVADGGVTQGEGTLVITFTAYDTADNDLVTYA